MHKTRILAVLILAVIGLPFTLHADEPTLKIEKSIVVVLDTSPSIDPYFSKLKSVLASALVDERLEIDDYFTLIGFAGEPRICDGAFIMREEDKAARSEIWKNIRLEGRYTDLGRAMTKAIETQKDLTVKSKKQPLILFITDGEHFPPHGSLFENKTVNDFFKDPPINEKELFDTWYFIGLGKDLKDIEKIASQAGRKDWFISIDNPDFIETLREWIKSIPEPPAVPSVKFDAWSFGGNLLKSKPGKIPLLIGSGNREIKFQVKPEFSEGSVKIIPGELRAFFLQDDGQEKKIPIDTVKPTQTTLKPGDTKTMSASSDLTDRLTGKGTLTLELDYSLNGIDYRMSEETPTVHFVTPIKLFLRTWGTAIASSILVVAGLLMFLILRKRAPVKIVMETIGNPKKSSTVAMKIGGKAEFGGRASLSFRLNGTWPAVIGHIARIGPDSWDIAVRESESFPGDFTGGSYRLGSLIRLITDTGEQLSIRFIVKK